MTYSEIFKILGKFLTGFSLTLLIPLAVGVYYQFIAAPAAHPQPHSTFAFIYSFILCLGIGMSFIMLGSRTEISFLYRREGIAAVVMLWLILPAIGALPFVISHTLNNPVQAYFEAASGLTTTGSSIITAKKFDPQLGKEIPIVNTIKGDTNTTYSYYGTIEPIRGENGVIVLEGVEAISKALLLWRSMLQWLGGIGIVVLFVAILPALGVGGKILFNTEVPGPIKETLTPRILDTAKLIWKVYLGLTVLQIGLLMATNKNMPLLDAINITFCTLSTGGFAIKNSNIAFYDNVWTEWVVILFMLFGSLNFSLYFYMVKGKFFRLSDRELFVFLTIVISGCLFTAYYIFGTPKILLNGNTGIFNLHEALRHGSFQFISAISDTGFATADYDRWPFSVQLILLVAMYLGGMAGSTTGGIKTIRLILLFRTCQDKIESLYRPNTVRSLQVGHRVVDPNVAMTVLCFFATLISLSVLGTFLLSVDGVDLETSLSVITSSINNSGFGFREAGPTSSFAFLSNFSLIVSSLWMILGRLEFFAILLLLIPAFWRRDG
jgi:trk system potassium uptake protein TrkH